MDERDTEWQKSFVRDFISKHPLTVISTLSGNSIPASAAVYVGMKSDLTLYFGTRTDTQKYENIQHNQDVALTFVSESTVETIQLRGKATILSENEEVAEAMELINSIVAKEKSKWMPHIDETSPESQIDEASRSIPPVGQLGAGSASIFVRIKPHWLRYRRYDADLETGKKFTEYLIAE